MLLKLKETKSYDQHQETQNVHLWLRITLQSPQI